MTFLQSKKEKKKIEDLIDDTIKDKDPFSTFDDFWWEEELFSKKVSKPTAEASTKFLKEIDEMFKNILRNLRPVDNRTEQELIDNQFIPIDDRTQQELEDDDYISLDERTEQELKDDDYISIDDMTEQEVKDDISLKSDNKIEDIDLTSAWDSKKTKIARSGPIYKLSTDYNQKVKAANKIKNKYLRKTIGQKNLKNKISAEWLKAAGYLETKDQDKISYMFIPPKKDKKNDSAHFIRTEIDSTDFKKENLISKVKKDSSKKPYHYKKKHQKIMNQTKPLNF